MRYSPRVDCAFRKLFRSREKNRLLKSFVKSFVNSVLLPDEQLKKVTLMNENRFKEDWKDKFPLLYIKGVDEQGRYYNIEMQVNDDEAFGNRASYHWSWLFRNTYFMGYEARKTISIHVMNFDRLGENVDYHSIHCTMEHISGIKTFGNDETHIIVLEKFIKTAGELKSKLDYWMYFLATADKYEKDNLPEIIEKDSELKEAFDALENLELDSKEKKIYEKQLKKFGNQQSKLGKESLEMEIEKFASLFNSSKSESN
jgi:predicted transposase/invertase (TIGR01784 family)